MSVAEMDTNIYIFQAATTNRFANGCFGPITLSLVNTDLLRLRGVTDAGTSRIVSGNLVWKMRVPLLRKYSIFLNFCTQL